MGVIVPGVRPARLTPRYVPRLPRPPECPLADPRYLYFLAHASPDKDYVREVYRALDAAPHPTADPDERPAFFDEASIPDGARWDLAIPTALTRSRAVVVFVSRRYKAAWFLPEEVQRAIHYARDPASELRLIPVYLDGWPRAPTDVPYGLYTSNAIDASGLSPAALNVGREGGCEGRAGRRAPDGARMGVGRTGLGGAAVPVGDEPPTAARASWVAANGAPDKPYDEMSVAETALASLQTAETGTHTAGASPFGVEDAAGNVWEWCRDVWVDGRPGGRLVDPCQDNDKTGQDDASVALRVVRGGSWGGPSGNLRCAERGWDQPQDRNDNLGFRVVFRPPARFRDVTQGGTYEPSDRAFPTSTPASRSSSISKEILRTSPTPACSE